jgi:hypothetical protein
MSSCRSLLALGCVLTCVACGPSSELDRAATGPLSGRFYVSDHFAPSGHMGDGEQPGFIVMDISNERCVADPSKGEQGPPARLPGVGGDCYRFTYQPDLRPGAEMWGGVYWVYPANDWGTRQGRKLLPPYKRIRFKAAGAPRPDASNPNTRAEPRVSFLVGGIGSNPSDPQPFKDEIMSPFGDIQAVANAYLTTEWQSLEIDLTDFIPTQPFHMISGFCWTTNYQPGVPTAQSPPTVIYIDDIVWDTE